MLSTYEQKPRLKLTATIVTVLVIAGLVLLADHLKAQKSTGTSVAQHTPSAVATTPGTSDSSGSPSSTSSNGNASSGGAAASGTSSSGYKDGTYTASSSYYVPSGQERIQISLTLSSGAVTGASIQNSENDADSASYQEEFAAEYKSYVVGKKIDGLRLTNIAGASDTTQGFNAALSKIAAQAQA